jgi:hypothetical protein
MQLPRSIIFPLVATLGVVAAFSTLRAQVTGGEQNLPNAKTSPEADVAALQKKAIQAQARIRLMKTIAVH